MSFTPRKAEFYNKSLWPTVKSHLYGRDLYFRTVRNVYRIHKGLPMNFNLRNFKESGKVNFTFRAVAQETFIPTNQKHNPVLCSDTSSMWNFWARFSDVISQGKAEVLSRNVGCFPRLSNSDH